MTLRTLTDEATERVDAVAAATQRRVTRTLVDVCIVQHPCDMSLNKQTISHSLSHNRRG